MIFLSNPLFLPLVLIIWAADAWLLLATIRLILRESSLSSQSPFCTAISRLTDPLLQFVNSRLSRLFRKGKPLPSWLLWLIVILSTLTIRQILIMIVAA
ncbi:MAG: hypothetical protein JW720_12200 [Sedimentisphaerales bacterium]|nr:hypothetical protein [Sedimentisphaerales bacterium]